MNSSSSDPRLGTLRKLRDEHRQRSDADQRRAISFAGAVARFVDADDSTSVDPDTMRAFALAITASQQLWLATNQLAAREVKEALPAINHFALVAEGLVAVADLHDRQPGDLG